MFFLLFMGRVVAQKILYGFETGLGSYQMTDLKSVMSEGLSPNLLHPPIVTNFPPYLFFSPSITFCNYFSRWGLNFTLFSTGARASIRDYSGEYRYDNVVVGFAPALFSERTMFVRNKFVTYLHLDVGVLYSTLNLDEFLKVNDSEIFHESLDAMSWNVFVKPCLKTTYPISERFNLQLNVGYHFDLLRGGLSEPTELATYLKYVKGNGLKLQWDGIRIGFGCTYVL